MTDADLIGLLRRTRMAQAIIIDLLDAGMGTPEIAEATMRMTGLHGIKAIGRD